MRSSDRHSVLRGYRTRQRSITTITFALLAALTLAACSSAPDPPEYEVDVKNRASEFAEFGNQYFSEGEYDLALRFFNLSLDENVSVDHLPGIAKSHNSIARVQTATGNLSAARQSVVQALEFARLADDSEQETQALINRGEIALREGDLETALRDFEAARENRASAEEEPDPVLLHNLGTLYARQESFDEARRMLDQARAINEEQRNWAELASNYFMLASISSRQGQHEQAREQALQALDYDKRAENSPGIAADLQALGRISERLNDDEAAYRYYLRSLRVFLSFNSVPGSLDTLSALEDVARRTGRDAEADEFAAQRRRIEESLR